MADVLTPAQRRFNMSQIKGRDTAPEMTVRQIAHGMGYRYRLHRRDLPGRPDLVFVSRHRVIFVHGCFWHRHECRFGNVRPKTNAAFWKLKIEGNVSRDKRNTQALTALGWTVCVLWECELSDRPAVQERLMAYLGPPRGQSLR
jgi:DNA mismatch endonuclease (patch repair protein)